MQRIDRQFLETPFYGVRQMTWHLQNEGHTLNPKRRLMRTEPCSCACRGLPDTLPRFTLRRWHSAKNFAS